MTGKEIIAPPLTKVEQADYARLEGVVRQHLTGFILAGNALAEIRNRKLFRREFPTFEDYCQDVWEIGRPRAYQLMNGAEVIKNLSTIVDKTDDGDEPFLPTNEAQARPLTVLDPEEQVEVWKLVQNAVNGGKKLTAKLVEQIVSNYLTNQVQDAVGDSRSKLTKIRNKLLVSDEFSESYKSLLNVLQDEFKNGYPPRQKREAMASMMRGVVEALEA